MNCRWWADKDKQALKKIYPAYLRGEVSRDELMKVFRRSFNSINYMAHQLGLTGKTFSTLDEDYFKKLCKRFETQGGNN